MCDSAISSNHEVLCLPQMDRVRDEAAELGLFEMVVELINRCDMMCTGSVRQSLDGWAQRNGKQALSKHFHDQENNTVVTPEEQKVLKRVVVSGLSVLSSLMMNTARVTLALDSGAVRLVVQKVTQFVQLVATPDIQQ